MIPGHASFSALPGMTCGSPPLSRRRGAEDRSKPGSLRLVRSSASISLPPAVMTACVRSSVGLMLRP
eukprot:8184691-Alexandrium_andersonii.AAC.1